MHPHLATVLACLDEARRDLGAAVDAVPPALRAQSPAPGCWSVNQVLEHLGRVDQMFVGNILKALEQASADGLGPEEGDPAPLGPLMADRVRDRTNRREAPDAAQPTRGLDTAAALEEIDAAHAALHRTLGEANGLALSTVIYEHRFFGPLSAYQWVELIAGHEARHAAQIREIAAQIAAA